MRILKIISIICSTVGIILSLFGLILGLSSINASGWDGLGVLFIIPSIAAMLVVLFDLLITLGKVKRGLTYSYISGIIKMCLIVCLLSNAIAGLSIIMIPSIFNIIKLTKAKKHHNDIN